MFTVNENEPLEQVENGILWNPQPLPKGASNIVRCDQNVTQMYCRHAIVNFVKIDFRFGMRVDDSKEIQLEEVHKRYLVLCNNGTCLYNIMQ